VARVGPEKNSLLWVEHCHIVIDIYKNSDIVLLMNITTSNEIKFKLGLTIDAGTPCVLQFDGKTTVATITAVGSNVGFRLRCSSLPRYFNRFKAPSIKTMQNWSDQGIAKSVLGNRVEPDGFDPEGSPSWMLVMGII